MIINCILFFFSMDRHMHASKVMTEEHHTASSKYMAFISQTQRMSGILEDFHVSNTWEDAVQATSLTLLAKIIATREFSTFMVQSTFDSATNLVYCVEVSFVYRANNIFKLKFQYEVDCNKI